ncbi:MAG: citrate synthase [Candidatus Binatia bacterium]|nr:citrate synthase [Candidatus Binatia bacterium]
MPNDSLTVVDNRTGKTYEIPIEHDTIPASELAKIKASPDGPGLWSFDVAIANTATCKSNITYLDGEGGVLRYRGYPIEELAERSSYLEVAYLLVKGELPSTTHFQMWQHNIKMHTIVHENLKQFIDGFRYDAHPMGILIGTVAALSTFYPDAKAIHDVESRRVQTRRLIAKLPTIAALAFRHSRGLKYVSPDNDLSYTGNFLSMLFKMTELKYRPNPVLEKALDVLFILHADHEQNCSTTTARVVGSSHADPYSVVSAAAAALSGPRHGGASEDVVRMLHEVGSVDKVPELIKAVKAGDRRLMGFGHRVYKNYDPRARIIKQIAYDVFEVTGKNPAIDVALELERIALEDEYFIERRLYPNVDFYSGTIYEAMGFQMEMFPVLFAIGRTAGWVAQWAEMLENDERIARPRQMYLGEGERAYVPLDRRNDGGEGEPEIRGPY